ncbi:hypothetical protein [Streptomyces cavernicola]|uniref:Tat pathway signal sequence domain protein n=1 Tax=Streptomyces cavernicola TaxID=3043613 RepID=A0ABT6S495_9ACTN|nr:hypothetical protein [Streptomyces sp. B-S-A6]MDI3402883.1 hypothetical protein [Streptomyces sp. B-S-A6]
MRATRRTLRSSVLAAGVMAVLTAVPAATACADAPQPTEPRNVHTRTVAHVVRGGHGGQDDEAARPGPGQGAPLLAAGGGLAAAGAASLTFAMLRRGRSR